MSYCIDLSDTITAYARIQSKIHKTPVLQATSIDTGDLNVWYKCENLQKTGSFKFRGATNAVAHLKENSEKSGSAYKSVVTHSSGNHGQALALAAKELNLPAHIVMPSNSPDCKVSAVKSYGANVIFCEPNDEARTSTSERIAKENSGLIIHPNQDPMVIAGQASIAIELVEQLNALKFKPDAVLVPVGGGGMIAGMAMFLKNFDKNIKVIALEPEMANDCALSKKAGKLIPNAVYPKTVADGVRTSIGDNSWPIIRDFVDDVFEISDVEIIEGWRLGMERLKVLLEPTAGLGVAAVTSKRFREKYSELKNVAVVLCGGNVDIKKISSFF